MIFLDTGPLAAFCDRDDKLHGRAVAGLDAAWSGEHGAVVTTDHVVAETLTLLMARVGREDVARDFLELVEPGPRPPPALLVGTSLELLREATALHLKHFDRRLSMVDCTLLAHAKASGAKILTFDRGFDGLADVVHP